VGKQSERVELKGSARAALPGGKDTGSADPTQQIEVTVLLRRGSEPNEFPSMGEVGAQLPAARKYLTREEFASVHGASAGDIEKIRAFAAQYGLKSVSEDAGLRTVKLGGTVEAFNKAFGVNLRRYQHSSGEYRCRTGGVTIPADLESVIEGVFGLDNRPQAKPHFRIRKSDPNVWWCPNLGTARRVSFKFVLCIREGLERAT
jgi:kumamolisin